MGRAPHQGVWGLPGAKDLALARAVLAELGVAHLAGRIVSRLSGGERRLLLVARALPRSRRCSCSTSPPHSSTCSTRPRCWSGCGHGCAPGWRRLPCSTTRTSPRPSPTRPCCSRWPRPGTGPLGRAARRGAAGSALRPRARRGANRCRAPPLRPAGVGVSARRLRRALAASAAVHVAVLAGLLALAHPRFGAAPAMRVALVGQPGTAGVPARSQGPGRAQPGVAAAERASPAVDPGLVSPRPPPSRSSTRASRRADVQTPGAEGAGDAAALGAEALVSAVQSDVWVLAGSSPPVRSRRRRRSCRAGRAWPRRERRRSREGPPTGDGTDPVAGGQGATLLAALAQRLAVVRRALRPGRGGPHRAPRRPLVPLHFCLDEAGRPSDVGLLGTTGSDVLDRAARDCVVPGALRSARARLLHRRGPLSHARLKRSQPDSRPRRTPRPVQAGRRRSTAAPSWTCSGHPCPVPRPSSDPCPRR